jgi:oligosaccharide repeat unit polymerase
MTNGGAIRRDQLRVEPQGATPSAFSWKAGSLLFLLLAVVIPMLVAGGQTPEDLSTALATVLTITVLSAAGLAWVYIHGKANVMWLGFWMYCYVLLGLAALTQITRDQWPLPVAPQHNAVTTASFLGLIGCFSWFIGYRFVHRRGGQPPATSIISDVRYHVFVWGAITITVLYIVTVGLVQLFTSRQQFGDYAATVFQSQSNATLAVAIGVVPIAVAFLVQLGRQRRGQAGVALWLTLILVLVLNLIVSNVFTSSRTWVGTIVMSVLLMVGKKPASARKMRALLVGWFVAFLVIFPQAAIFRNDLRQNVVMPNPAEALVTGDYDSFQQMVNGVVYVAESGLQWGNQLLGSTFFFVPRSIWPNKAEGTGVLLGQAVHLQFTNLSAPLWIEGYVDFGVVGTIVFMAAWGAACAALDRHFIAELRRGEGVFLLCVPLLAFWQTVILRGSLLAILPFVFAIAGCVLFLGWRGKVPQPESESAGTLLHEAQPATSTRSFL